MRHNRRLEEIERAKTQVLNPVLRNCAPGVEVRRRPARARAEVLSGLAREFGAAQIFVGRLGRSRIAALLFGSVAVGLVQISPVPVTVVP